MSETEATPFDARQLRRGLRDLAALSALPVLWTEFDPRRIAESLADALMHMLRLDLVYILVRDRADESPSRSPTRPGARLRRPEALLDPATLLAACDDEPTLLRELIRVFRDDSPSPWRESARPSSSVMPIGCGRRPMRCAGCSRPSRRRPTRPPRGSRRWGPAANSTMPLRLSTV
jgi:hypothetical protein